MKSWTGLMGPLLLAATLVGACGMAEGGDQGSESHWLSTCNLDDDCPSGECICGVCTVRCDTFMDCPFPLDRCTPSGEPFRDNCMAPAESGLCGVSTSERTKLALSQSNVAACDGDRTAELHLIKSLAGQTDAIALGDEGFALFANQSYTWGLGTTPSRVTFVDRAGQVVQEQPAPSPNVGWLSDVVHADGAFVLSGGSEAAAGQMGWVGKVDEHWKLLWEVEVGEPGVHTTYLNPLPDGGVIAMGVTSRDGLSDAPAKSWVPVVFWTRIDADGQVLWKKTEAPEGLAPNMSGNRLMTLTSDSQLVAIVPNGNGTSEAELPANMIRGGLDGTYQTSVLDGATIGFVQAVTALPNGRVAVSSENGSTPGATLTVIGADGNVEWERSFPGHFPAGVVYDASRNEVIFGGSGGVATQSTWMIAMDLEGNTTWELTREPQEMFNLEVSEISPTKGPGLLGIAVSPGGAIIGVGNTEFQLTYFVIGPDSCE